MRSIDNRDVWRRPTLFNTMLVLLGILAFYPLAGWMLTLLATGGQPLTGVLRNPPAGPMVGRILLAQAVGQILVLALPVLLLATRLSGERRPFGRANLRWLGIGKRGGVRPALLGGAGMLLLQPTLYSIVELQMRLLPLLGETGKALLREQEQLDQFIRTLAGDGSILSFLAASLVFVLTPAVCEELLFRGYLQKSLALNLGSGRAVLLAGVVFALFHMEWFNLLPLTLLGCYIGYLYQKSGNLLAPAVAHGANNLAALVLLHLTAAQGATGAMADSSPVDFWYWWVLVAASLFIFSQLMRYFPENPAAEPAENQTSGGRF